MGHIPCWPRGTGSNSGREERRHQTSPRIALIICSNSFPSAASQQKLPGPARRVAKLFSESSAFKDEILRNRLSKENVRKNLRRFNFKIALYAKSMLTP